jgi:Na+/phosphate symporter
MSPTGFVILVGVIFIVLACAALADLVLTIRSRPTVGDYVNQYVFRRPIVAVILAIVYGAMLTHFLIYIRH